MSYVNHGANKVMNLKHFVKLSSLWKKSMKFKVIGFFCTFFVVDTKMRV